MRRATRIGESPFDFFSPIRGGGGPFFGDERSTAIEPSSFAGQPVGELACEKCNDVNNITP